MTLEEIAPAREQPDTFERTVRRTAEFYKATGCTPSHHKSLAIQEMSDEAFTDYMRGRG